MTPIDVLACVLALLTAWKSWHTGVLPALFAALLVYGFTYLIGAALEGSGPAGKRPTGRPKGRPRGGGR
ncbi:hypothetical protein ACFZDG_35635 [Kitasatospora xanthocidica]|uniref:hypothetical protein n=1 Tax=Kitasatospora xanthocidica TaxID=83382 RepID=UPI0036EB2407